jgi:protease-4
MFGGNVVGDRSFEKIFEDIREDDDVAAVVLRVNSPGGSGLASDNMWHQIKLTQAEGKPVVVSMGDYAASGGYYISAPADYIVAEPGTLTGSIGVFGGKMNTGGLFEKVGITTHTWQRGRLAGLLATNTSFNDDERAKFREFLEGFYKTFVTRVSDGRKMSFEDVHTIAQGRVWTGAQAKENGLVDELGGLDVALNKAKELGKIGADEDYALERFPRTKTFFDQLSDSLDKQTSMSSMSGLSAEAAAVPELGEALGQLLILDRVLGEGGVAAMLPGRITVK